MISIVRATVEDAVEILKVKIHAFQEEIALYGFGPPGFDTLESQLNDIKEGYYYKILDDQKIIGGIGVVDNGADCYWIGVIFVDSGYQNQGIGTLAIQFLDSEFPNAKEWTLETPYLSFRNHHFYEKMGFVKVGETEPEPGNGFRLFLYKKEL